MNADFFQLKYSRANWQKNLPQLLPSVELFTQPHDFPLTNERERTIATARRQFGSAILADGKRIAFYEIDVTAGTVDLLRNRVALRELVARCIDEVSAHAVLAFFVQPGTNSYRLTYAAKESKLGEDLTIQTEQTATRRFTYILGPGETRRTATLRLAGLATDHARAKLADVTDAFSVEKLNKEFFDTYKKHYQKFCDHLIENTDATAKVFELKLRGLDDKAHDHALKPVRDFVKKLLGRLVFLHFLQKKGWLGCPATAKNWKNGDPNFLRQLFDSAPEADRKRFHSRRLVPLFFDTLNRERNDDLFAVTGTRVPYLNGGLFERDFNGVEQVDFPAELFANLLEFFSQYNFTIDENDPDDHEIGIDPEMLGHIFENLLEDNKDKGAYYTPKVVVQYMCQQSLIHALAGHFPDDAAAYLEIENLIRNKEPIDPKQENSWLATNAHALEKILDGLNICDPAIGSGAFPIGLLQEIYWTKLTLHPALDRAEAKRAIIQRSIHGVDIDAGAVEIARLRFWLALIVEEKNPVPLPNLDYQIMQGNSLLESFEGLDLSKISEPQRVGVTLLGNDQVELGLARPLELTVGSEPQEKLDALQRKYFACHDPEKKAKLRAQIDAAILRAIDYELELRREILAATLENWRRDLARRQKLKKDYEPTAKELKTRDTMQAELDALAEKKAKLHTLLENPRAERPFYLWHLWFRHILTAPPVGCGGFDIVIGNPPYIQLQNDQGALATKYQDSGFETFARMGDIYALFYERGRQLLRDGGHLCYITSNKWMRAGYGEKLRAFLATKTQPKILIDFAGQKIFEAATVDTNILLFERRAEISTNPTLACIATEECRENMSVFVKQHATPCRFGDSQSWVILSPIEQSIKAKIEKIGTPLKDWDISINYGIKTGFNDAFIIDEAKRAEILANCKDAAERKRTDEIIRPILRGRDIKRYSYEWANLYFLFIPWHFPLHKDDSIVGASERAECEFQKQYLAIYNYLLKYKRKLSARNKEEVNVRYEWYALQRWAANYWEDFSKPKIMWAETMRIRRENNERFPRFSYSPEPIFTDKTCFMAVGDDLKLVLAFLNSVVGRYQFSQTVTMMDNGGYLMQKIYVEQVKIGKVDAKTKARLVSLVEKLLNTKTIIANEETEKEIDALVFDVFRISQSEQFFLKETLTAPLERG